MKNMILKCLSCLCLPVLAACGTDNAGKVDAVADESRTLLPLAMDALTTWTDVEVDHEGKSVGMKMDIAGSTADFDNLQALVDSIHGDVVSQLKIHGMSEPIVRVPVEAGYSLVYYYVSDAGGDTVATAIFRPDELK